ncbi:alpha-hydroxy acid oxidase [Nocardioides aestuarii]|uniref:Alpha-hydroxy acid oxidase n=1 Tax=Nocardioides aestuarii TaxID=252231 RepID=A0ABW4TSH8_9ACTN
MTWVTDLAEQSRSVMPRPMWEYVEAGADDGITTAEAAAAWRDVRFAPRVLSGGPVDLTTDLLGDVLRTPVGIAPTSLQRVAHPAGEPAMAAGAAAVGALHVVSSNAGHRFADIDAGSPWWLQAYLPPDRHSAAPVLRAAVAAGARAVVLTVDTPVPGPKRRPPEEDWAGTDLSWFRCNFEEPGEVRWADDLAPADIGWLHEVTGVPVVVKGVLRADDARACVDAGASAVWVSNHGGRQLDRATTTRAALPRVAAAVGEQVPVLVDGGIRSGLDVLAALSLGADAALLGRPPLHALALGGADEVERLLSRLADETAQALLLAGCRTPRDARGIAVPSGPTSP